MKCDTTLCTCLSQFTTMCTSDRTTSSKTAKTKTSASVTDWCISPHGITRPQNQSSPNSGKKCLLARSLTVQNFVAIGQEMSEISAIKNFCSPKKWAKIQRNRLRPATPKAPHHAKFHRDRWNHLGEKLYKIFTPFNSLALQGTPLG